jgi:hypothetical protein
MVLRSLPGLPRSTTTIWPGSDAGNVSDRRHRKDVPIVISIEAGPLGVGAQGPLSGTAGPVRRRPSV